MAQSGSGSGLFKGLAAFLDGSWPCCFADEGERPRFGVDQALEGLAVPMFGDQEVPLASRQRLLGGEVKKTASLSSESTAIGSTVGSSYSSVCEEAEERPLAFIEGEGCTYQGSWLAKRRHGRGVAEWSNGARYVGQFKHDLPHGRGFMTDVDGGTYDGRFAQGLKHGFGVYVHHDGTCYEGMWRHDEKCGSGLERWADGAHYEGHYLRGLKHGHGVFTDGKTKYLGAFKEDNMHGQGAYNFPDGRRYFGDWAEGRMHGEGRMEWPGGSAYEGGFLQGRRTGIGTLLLQDGSRCTGSWVGGRQHGAFVREAPDGRRTAEQWSNGVLVVPSKSVEEPEV